MATEDATVTVTQFTDPMCTWCWGSEPILRHLRTAYGDRLELRFVVGGLVEDFETFFDAANDITDPGDVASHWLEASERHEMPVDTAIFDADPAQSTYPASVAFAAVRQQDRALGRRYLRRLREAYATAVRNVNRRDEQVRLAESVGLAETLPVLVAALLPFGVGSGLVTPTLFAGLSALAPDHVRASVMSHGLTEKGRELTPVLDELDAWARRWGEEAPAGPNPRLHDD